MFIIPAQTPLPMRKNATCPILDRCGEGGDVASGEIEAAAVGF